MKPRPHTTTRPAPALAAPALALTLGAVFWAAAGTAQAQSIANAPSLVHSKSVNGLQLVHPWTPTQKKAGSSTTGYLTVENAGPADTLTAASCPVAGDTAIVDAQGRPLAGGLPIPAHTNTTLTPSGPHLALSDLHFDVPPGTTLPCSLTFANDGPMQTLLIAHTGDPKTDAP